MTHERALTALIQGRNAIERARREVAHALEIFSHLEEQLPQSSATSDADWLRRLREALDQLEASHIRLEGPGASQLPASVMPGGRRDDR